MNIPDSAAWQRNAKYPNPPPAVCHCIRYGDARRNKQQRTNKNYEANLTARSVLSDFVVANRTSDE
jgi:hypothetical protein